MTSWRITTRAVNNSASQNLIPGSGETADPSNQRNKQSGKPAAISQETVEHRIRDRSPTSLLITDEFFAENAIAVTHAITLKHSLAEWSRIYPRGDPGFQRVLLEAKKANTNLNSLPTTLGITLFKLPESTSHLAQITERVKAQRESETKRVNPAISHPKVKINLEGNKMK
ncbi:hypothetical protein AVEN_109035-1 [Araneus ventricosus]|uniref:Uncharacterized protein n=1 Tax=Araneus ventricosus TaxID=182803 RepID=A0A4Y2M867_ARAVE|nr:hypothetical protein AVEN_109035-1 [Araneus ventricosus]